MRDTTDAASPGSLSETSSSQSMSSGAVEAPGAVGAAGAAPAVIVPGDGIDTATRDAFCAFRAQVEAAMGREAWRAWGEAMHLAEANTRRVRLITPSPLHWSRIVDAVGERRLRGFWRDVDLGDRTLVLAAATARDMRAPRSAPVRTMPQRGDAAAGTTASPAAQDERRSAPAGEAQGPLGMRPATFDTYVFGEANKVAAATVRAITNDAPSPFDLAVIHGGYGSGKSHLLRAAAEEANAVGGRGRAMYFSADRFREDYVKAVRSDAGVAFKERVRSCAVLIVDDIHLLANAKQTQGELHAAVTEKLASGGRVVLAADRAPEHLEGLDEAFRARLAGAASIGLEQPDLDMRREILALMARANPYLAQGIAIPEEVLDFIASAVAAMPRDLEAALNNLLSRTALIGLPVTRETARDALTETLSANGRRVTVEEIQKVVASYHGLKVSDLLSKKRTRDIVRPRQEAMYFCKELTSRSLPDIARRFGGMDHTTVMHAVKRVRQLTRDDASVRSDVEALRRMLTRGRSGPSATV